MDRIAYIKTGWCESYDGDPVIGNHSFIKKHGFGHEIFNMRPVRKLFYVYLPPIGSNESAPSPEGEFDDWWIILVAPRNGSGRLVVVGIYESAKFIKQYLPRPYMDDDALDPLGAPFSYTVVAKKAYLVPPDARTQTLPANVLGKSPIFYARGNERSPKNPSRKVMAEFAEHYIEAQLKPQSATKSIKVAGTSSGGGFANSEHRKIVEKLSMTAATKYFIGKGYSCVDVSMEKGRGYDILATKGKEQLYVEVKGTVAQEEGFFITKNENAASYLPNWRLCIVSNIFARNYLSVRDGNEYRKDFKLLPIQYQGVKKRNSTN